MGKTLIQQARGKGGIRYRAPSFRYFGEAKFMNHIENVVKGKITDIVDCPGHLAPLIKIKYENGMECLIQAPEGVKVGEEVTYGSDVKSGNILKLKSIPEGTAIYNIELRPGDGGKYCRTSGVCAKITAKHPNNTVSVLLPSKQEKIFSSECRAVIGIVSGGGRVEKPILKAGKRLFMMMARNKRYPNPSGAAQNAVDHPFGNKRTSRKAKQRPVNKFAPPGRKVGKLWPRQTGRGK